MAAKWCIPACKNIQIYASICKIKLEFDSNIQIALQFLPYLMSPWMGCVCVCVRCKGYRSCQCGQTSSIFLTLGKYR